MPDHPLKQYFYEIPEENIRRQPLAVRDSARLFVYDTKTDTVTFDTFANLSSYLPTGSVMVINNTGVIPARVKLQKDTGKVFDGLMLLNEGFDRSGAVPVIVNREIFPGRRVSIGNDWWFTIMRQDEQKFYLKPNFTPTLLPELLSRFGTTPTPYYLGSIAMAEEKLRERYQTIFANKKRSVAAPTASLHFTDEVFDSLTAKGVERVEMTLDVGLGTFQEIEQKNVDGKFLHREPFHIPDTTVAAIQKAKSEGRPVVAVGTTAVRALEASAQNILGGGPVDLVGDTDLFIMPPYVFKIPDILITNFHVPQSSLMALVDAFLEHKGAKRRIVELYQLAIQEGFMFYSFGDSMLIL